MSMEFRGSRWFFGTFKSGGVGNESAYHPSRPVMNVADSPKKKKILPGLLSAIRDPVPSINPKTMEVRAVFDRSLEDTKEVSKCSNNHAKLLEAERKSAWDRAARYQSDLEEQRAAIIIREIREYERRVVFGNLASEALPAKSTRDMGGQFLTNKDRIDQESLLFQIARKVPKGGLLHVHFNAELHPERLFERARSMENVYIRSIRPLQSQDDLDETEVVFNVLDSDQVVKGVSIFDPLYPGNASNWKTPEWMWKVWMPWKDFREEFKNKFHHRDMNPRKPDIPADSTECPNSSAKPYSDTELEPAETWLRTKIVLSEEEVYGLTQTVNGSVFWSRHSGAR
jgi:adenosine deaminase CECR1